ncbi:26S proteasome non-ATPase regulatory subunit 9 [Nymphaea thermarum]|nr:26S proteasome non-ATPase regulatory subunit 9 [Nymphaea thermarum]
MVGSNLRKETMSLMKRRELMEEEMNAIISRLTAPGAPGISGNLLDSEGFPRADIDIMAIRSDRHRLAELRNDHRNLTSEIEKSLQVLHSARSSSSLAVPSEKSAAGEETSPVASCASAASSGLTDHIISEVSSDAMEEDPVSRVPFAVVDEIASDSPAAEDGIQLGDQILKFGNVEGGGQSLLPRLATEAQSNQGNPVPLIIIRQGAVINLIVTPRRWHGRGLLGCHFRIL